MAAEDVSKGMLEAVAGIAANEARKLYEDGVRADAAKRALLEGAQEGVLAGLSSVVGTSPSWASMPPDETTWSDAAQRRKRPRRRRDPRAEEQMIEDTYAVLGVR